ncbi:MAG: tRNA dihydrouridine synthase DusB [Pseudomonadota bacterium]
MLTVGDIRIDPPVILAPMAGITDCPFREIVAGFGAGLVVSEMVATQELLAKKPSVRAKAEVAAGSVGTSVQIAGRDPLAMAETARMLAGDGARIIDINMGCPARKVTGGACGSALLRDPDQALRIIDAVVGAVAVPVTLKTRLGWDETNLNAPEIARAAELAGVQMITIHGRTRCQFYKGQADWTAIRRLVEAVAVPVIANGDIVDAKTARRALELSGAAGVMIGRGAIGKPWLPAEIAAHLEGRMVDLRPRGRAFADLVAAHAEAHLTFYGADPGIRAMRKHMDGYLSQVAGSAGLRGWLIRETDADKLFRGIAELGDLDDREGSLAA